ncbi:substrate-binding periplasmic protein [Desulfovibrio oxyclinae]|uniref:substrate-binding periplasmic protein n=1 Tax=Desulfovibrio oxyclinae TaxID=63560 RepID=UPI00035E5D12|nr:transporter substrate-binding domain-containing protein [Desulfovibrio oxyclinae]
MSRISLAFALILLLSAAAFAEPLKIVTLSYPPYEFMEDGKVKGVATRVVREVFQRMDVEIEIELLEWADALEAVRTGEADAIYTAFRTPEREEFLVYPTTELVGQVTSLFVREGSAIDYNGDLVPLAKYSFGVVEKVSYGSFFDAAVEHGIIDKLIVSRNGEQSVRRFLAGESDILVSNWLEAWTILDKLNRKDGVRALSPPLQNIPSYLAFSKKSEHLDLVPGFEEALRSIRLDGTYGKLFKLN